MAIKLLRRGLEPDDAVKVKREVQLQASLSHVNIVELRQVRSTDPGSVRERSAHDSCMGLPSCSCKDCGRAMVQHASAAERVRLHGTLHTCCGRCRRRHAQRMVIAVWPACAQVVLTRKHLAIVQSYEAGGDLQAFCSRMRCVQGLRRRIRAPRPCISGRAPLPMRLGDALISARIAACLHAAPHGRLGNWHWAPSQCFR